MKSLCLFSSYSQSDSISDYIFIYLYELKKHFTKVEYLTNQRSIKADHLNKLKKNKISVTFLKNEGFDFGMWSKALLTLNLDEWDEISLVNDSCILFRTLDDSINKIRSSGWEYAGLISSWQVSWHIQSYFIVLQKKVFNEVVDYFSRHGYKTDFTEVIECYEVGLCSHLISKGFKLGSNYQLYENSALLNPSFAGIDLLIKNGFPLIKRKLITGEYRRNELRGLLLSNFIFNPRYYCKVINKSVMNPILDINEFAKSNISVRKRIQLYFFSFVSTCLSLVISMVRKIKKAVGIKKSLLQK